MVIGGEVEDGGYVTIALLITLLSSYVKHVMKKNSNTPNKRIANIDAAT